MKTTEPTGGMTIVIAWINIDGTRSAVVWLNSGTILDAYNAFDYANQMNHPLWDVLIFNPADADCLRKAKRQIERSDHALDKRSLCGSEQGNQIR